MIRPGLAKMLHPISIGPVPLWTAILSSYGVTGIVSYGDDIAEEGGIKITSDILLDPAFFLRYNGNILHCQGVSA